jgi:hypothetical protein
MASRSGATLRRLQKYNVAEIITVLEIEEQ